MSVQDSHYIWRHFFSAVPIIVREFLTAATLVIGLSAMSGYCIGHAWA